MKYSIIIPIYHSQDTIERCIKPFIDVSACEDIEILCVGDKVDDPTHAVVQDYADRFPGVVKLCIQNGRGNGAARNYGLDTAQGDYIMFVDADDYVEPDILEICTKALIEFDADFVFTGAIRIKESGKVDSRNQAVPAVTSVEVAKDNVNRLAFVQNAPWGKLYKRDFIGDNRFPESTASAYEDLIFFLSLLPKLRRYVLLPDVLYNYVVQEVSKISEASNKKTEIFRKDFVSLRNRYKSDEIPDELKEPFLKMLDIAALIHAGISDAYRMVAYTPVTATAFCADVKKFLDTEFPGWRYIPLKPYGQLTLRCFLLWGVKCSYILNLAMIPIHIYIFMIKYLKIDIKW